MTQSAPVTFGPYSPVVRRGNIVWTPGVVGRYPDSTLDPDFEGQVRKSFGNLERSLCTANATLSDVVAVTVYLADLVHTAEFNKLYAEYFQEPYPVRTTVQAGLAPGVLFEMNAQAVVEA